MIEEYLNIEDRLKLEKLDTIIKEDESDEQLLCFVATDTKFLNDKFEKYFLEFEKSIKVDENKNEIFKSILNSLEKYEKKLIVLNLYELKEYQSIIDEFQFKRDYIPEKKLKFVFLLHTKQYETFKVKAYDFFSFGDFIYSFSESSVKSLDLEIDTKKLDTLIVEYKEKEKTNLSIKSKLEFLLDISDEASQISKYSLALEYLQNAENIARKKKEFFYLISSIKQQANIFSMQGEYQRAITILKNESSLIKKLKSLEIENDINHIFGNIYSLRNEDKIALRYYQKNLDYYEQQNINNKIAVALIDIAQCYESLGEFDKTTECISKAETLVEEDNYVLLSLITNTRGNYYFIQGQLSLALELYIKALEYAQKDKDNYNMMTCYGNIALTYRSCGELDLSLQYYKYLEEISSKMKTQDFLAKCYMGFSHIFSYKGWGSKAKEQLSHAIEIFTKTQNNFLLGTSYMHLAVILIEEKNFIEAYRYLEESYIIIKNSENRLALQSYKENLIHFYLKSGELQKAKDLAFEFLEELKNDKSITKYMRLYSNLGEIYLEEKFYEVGLDYLKKALEMAKEFNLEKGEILYNMGKIYEGLNSFHNAKLHYKKSLKIYEYIDNRDKIKKIKENIKNLEKLEEDKNA